MKICWANLEGIKLTRNGVFLEKNASYIYKDTCKNCGEPYLGNKHSLSNFCSRSCAGSGEGHWNYGKNLTDTHKAKLSKAFKEERNPFYGKTHSDSTKERLSTQRIGKKHTLEARQNMSKARKGKPIHSEKEKKRRSKIFSGVNNPMYGRKGELSPAYGRVVSEETKKKLSLVLKGKMLGESNPNWRGGVSYEPYCPIWSDKGYKVGIRERDDNNCQNPYCYKTSKRLSIHHIDYDKKNCHPNNLITVCTGCNSRANKDRKWHTEWYRVIMFKKFKYEY